MLTVYQDGAAFYGEDAVGQRRTWKAPFHVSDYDIEAAEAARAWFITQARKEGLDFCWEQCDG